MPSAQPLRARGSQPPSHAVRQSRREEPNLVTAEARMPRRVALGVAPGATDTLAVRSVRCETTGARQRVVVESSHLKIRRLICSSKDQRPIGHCRCLNRRAWLRMMYPGMRRFAFDLDGLPPGAVAKNATLTFTAVSPTDAIEVQARLDLVRPTVIYGGRTNPIWITEDMQHPIAVGETRCRPT